MGFKVERKENFQTSLPEEYHISEKILNKILTNQIQQHVLKNKHLGHVGVEGIILR